jgi:PAS domain S-box-containing protein
MICRTGRSVTALGLCALILLSVGGVARGQSWNRVLSAPTRIASHPVPPFLVDSWTASHGLPEETINAVVQTRDGYLWLGSFSGLARFDGVTFRRFTTGNTPGVRSDRIHSLLEDRHGTLWIGTEGAGVFMLRDGVFSTPPWSAQLPDPQVWRITETRDGALWLGTNHGVARVDDRGELTTYWVRNGQLGSVNAITEGRDGVIWIGLWPGGVERIVGDTVQPFPAPALGDVPLVVTIHEDGAGIVWIGTATGLFRVEHERTELVSLRGPSGEPRVRSIVEDPQGGLWLGTSSGLWHVDGAARVRYGAEAGLSEDDLQRLHRDREGGLWVALHSGGLQRIKPRLATTYLPRSARRLTFVPIVGDGADGFWAGSICEGLWHFRDGVFEQFEDEGKNGLHIYCIWALHRDADGTLWLGGSRDGLVRIADGRAQLMPGAGLAVNAIIRDRAGALWIGSNGALKRLIADDTFESYDLPASGAALFLAERRAGGLWVGTTAGLLAFDRGKFSRWSRGEGLSHDIIRAVLEDEDGTLWLGTDGGGLNRMKDGRVTHYGATNGLLDEVVSQILDDGHGFFWMSGSKGVSRVSRAELASVAEGRATRVSPVLYDTNDGMMSGATGGGGQPAGWRAPDGRLWFPTTAGVVSIDPAVSGNTLPPPVTVTSVVVDQRASEPTAFAKATASQADVMLSPGVQNLEIHYAGLSFTTPDKVQFRYRLAGYDEQWVEAGPRRVAYYSYLPPGAYRFEVLARSDTGVWSTEGAELTIRQKPHFYQTGWFALLAAVALTLAGAAAYRLRLRHLLHRTRELEAAVDARTTEVVSQRNELATVHQELIETHGQLTHGHDELTKAHGNLLATLNETSLGVCMIDRSGVVSFLSTTAARVLGCTSEEAVGRTWRDILPLSEDDRGRLDTLIAQPAGQRRRLPVRLDAGDEHRYWMEIDVRDDPRKAGSRILFLHDVTELYDLQRLLDGRAQFQGLIGDTAAMRLIYRQIRDVAVVDATVVIEGETGTGKELVARAIHDASERHARPFVAVNCAGLTESLLTSQLFGHRRGAFTGALADQIGLFEAAQGGTLLLDEIGDISPSVQAALLRVLQEREVTRVGDSLPRKIDVRVLAATHRDLQAEMAAGRFRQDLLYRLRVVRIRMPPLRERRDDIPVLVAWFLAQARTAGQARVYELSRAAMDLLLQHPWPGNVRELKATIEAAAVAAQGPIIEASHLPAEVVDASAPAAVDASSPPGTTAPADDSLDARYRDHVERALKQTRGNRTAAARLLGVSRNTLYRRIRELGLDEA